MSGEIPTPAGHIEGRKLHFFWLADASGSMKGRRLEALNQAIRDVLPNLRSVMNQHPEVRMLMRAIRFSSSAEWHIGPEPVPLGKFQWVPLEPGTFTATAQAVRLLCSELTLDKMPQRRGLPPVCILISDGYCTDSKEDYQAALGELEALPWGKRAVRLAIAIGDESEYDERELLRFVSHKEVGVLKAHNASQLLDYITWSTIEASIASSKSRDARFETEQLARNVQLGEPPLAPVAGEVEAF